MIMTPASPLRTPESFQTPQGDRISLRRGFCRPYGLRSALA